MRNSVEKKARSLDAGSGVARRLSEKRRTRRSPRKETIQIFGVCSMQKCTGAPIAAMKISNFWVSQCLRHSKGHGTLDMNKVTQGTRSTR
jgi:hypothetical protein